MIELATYNTQENMRVVDALLTLRDENGVKERQGLQECAIAFGKATEGDFDAYLDTLMEVYCVHHSTRTPSAS